MSRIFLKRFLKEPTRVASIVPSSPVLVRKVMGKMDFSGPRMIAEFGPGEGVHTRALLKRAHPDSRVLLFELDAELAEHNRRQFAHDKRVEVLSADCRTLREEATRRGIDKFDYIFSGIPFSIMDKVCKQEIMLTIHECLKPNASFIIYQVTNELKRFGEHFDRIETDWCPINIPPMFVTVYHKNGRTSGSATVRKVDSPEPAPAPAVQRDRETA